MYVAESYQRVYLPNQQYIRFEEGHEQEALSAASHGTKLDSWFKLNETDNNASQMLYTDIPYNYIYSKNEWKRRQRQGIKVIGIIE